MVAGSIGLGPALNSDSFFELSNILNHILGSDLPCRYILGAKSIAFPDQSYGFGDCRKRLADNLLTTIVGRAEGTRCVYRRGRERKAEVNER
jgi:hypothetical protein